VNHSVQELEVLRNSVLAQSQEYQVLEQLGKFRLGSALGDITKSMLTIMATHGSILILRIVAQVFRSNCQCLQLNFISIYTFKGKCDKTLIIGKLREMKALSILL
jgi:hypothetical protein